MPPRRSLPSRRSRPRATAGVSLVRRDRVARRAASQVPYVTERLPRYAPGSPLASSSGLLNEHRKRTHVPSEAGASWLSGAGNRTARSHHPSSRGARTCLRPLCSSRYRSAEFPETALRERLCETQHGPMFGSALSGYRSLNAFRCPVKPSRLARWLFDCRTDLSAAGSSFELSCTERNEGSITCMPPFAATTVWTRIARTS